jgi:hypothetical protein
MKTTQYVTVAERSPGSDDLAAVPQQLVVNRARFMKDFRTAAVVRFVSEKVRQAGLVASGSV